MAAGVVGTGTAGSCDEAAFDAAFAGGGSVTFNCGAAPHTITFTGLKDVLANTTVDGGSLITLSGGGTTQLFQVASGVDFTADNITLSDGDNAFGYAGAVYLSDPGTAAHFNNTAFSNNHSVTQGGAIAALNGSSVELNDVTLDGNTADNGAGALFLFGSSATITNSVFSNNSSSNDVGAMGLVGSSSAILNRVVFSQNTSPGIAAFEVQAGSTMTADLVDIKDHSGGTIVIASNGDLTINRSSLHNNSSGAVIQNFDGNLELDNVTIGENDLTGGTSSVVTISNGATAIYHSTIANNSSGGFSGGLSNSGAGATTTVTNSIISNNSPVNCSGLGISSFGGNIDSGNSCNFVAASDQINTNPLLSALINGVHLDFGGMPTSFYNLSSGSPAIDSALAVLVIDQIGALRPIDGDGDSVATPDSGAIEMSDFIAPILVQITPVPTPGTDATPSYTFSSTEAGTISYGGACSSSTTLAVSGNNTITFNALPIGIYNNCTLTVTDASSNPSLPLSVNTFEITSPAALPVSGGFGGSAQFGNPACSGAACFGITNATNPTDINNNPITSAESFFTDTQNHWAEQYIENIHTQCGINGYQDSDGNLLHVFKPDNHITRAELTMMVVGCVRSASTGQSVSMIFTPSFPDAVNHWAKGSIGLAESWKIIGGYPDGTFKPDQLINRAEALKIMLLAWNSADQIIGSNTSCQDVVADSWYAKYFYFALNQNIISGYQNSLGQPTGLCGPANNITRAEAAKIISNLL